MVGGISRLKLTLVIVALLFMVCSVGAKPATTSKPWFGGDKVSFEVALSDSVSLSSAAAATTRASSGDTFRFPGDDDTDGWYPDPPQSEVDRCVEDGISMPRYNATARTFQCYALTTTGPCRDGEWWTLDAFARARCSKRDCESRNDVMMTDDGKRCVGLKSLSTCPTGMEVGVNPHGRGECVCRNNFVPHTDPVTKLTTCYQEFLRGPCPPGQQYVLVNVTTSRSTCDRREDDDGEETLLPPAREPRCQPHNCLPSETRWKNGDCFEEVKCSDEVIFREGAKYTICPIHFRTLIVIPEICKDGERKTVDGDCRKVFDLGKERPKRRLALRTRSLARYLRMRRSGSGST